MNVFVYCFLAFGPGRFVDAAATTAMELPSVSLAHLLIIGWLLSALTKSVGLICTGNPDCSLSTSLISRGPSFDANGLEDVCDKEDFVEHTVADLIIP